MLNVDLQQLSLENVDSLQNGQCNDCNLQQQAVTYSQFAEVDSTGVAVPPDESVTGADFAGVDVSS